MAVTRPVPYPDWWKKGKLGRPNQLREFVDALLTERQQLRAALVREHQGREGLTEEERLAASFALGKLAVEHPSDFRANMESARRKLSEGGTDG